MAKKNKRQRVRVSRDKVRTNAQSGSGGGSFLILPEGITEWAPQKRGRYMIDILPYEVTVEGHPDEVVPGALWYKRPFAVHFGVGPADKAVVCPRSFGKKCPICEEADPLKKDWDENEDEIKELSPQKFTAFNILDPDRKNADDLDVRVFAISNGKFANPLAKEIEEADESDLGFYDVTDEGRTIKVRFSEEEYMGRKYLEASKLDFQKRDEMDEDDVLEAVADLDTIFNILSYDQIKALHEGEVEDEEDEDEETSKPKRKKRPVRRNRKDEDVDDDDDMDDEDEEEDGEEEEPPKKSTKRRQIGAKKKPSRKPAKDDEDEDDDDWEDEDEEEEEPPKKSKSKPKSKPTRRKPKEEVEEEDDDDWDDEDDEEEEPPKKSKPTKSKSSKSKSKPAPSDDEDDEDWDDDDWDDDDWEDDDDE